MDNYSMSNSRTLIWGLPRWMPTDWRIKIAMLIYVNTPSGRKLVVSIVVTNCVKSASTFTKRHWWIPTGNKLRFSCAERCTMPFHCDADVFCWFHFISACLDYFRERRQSVFTECRCWMMQIKYCVELNVLRDWDSWTFITTAAGGIKEIMKKRQNVLYYNWWSRMLRSRNLRRFVCLHISGCQVK